MTSDALDDRPDVPTAVPTTAVPTTFSPSTVWRVRPAVPADIPSIDALIRELALYEREPHAVQATPDDFRAALFNAHPRVHCLVLEVDAPAGPTVVGIAVWFVSFSTWRGRHGIWLEDLFVRPEFRGLGGGRALLTELAAIGAERGYARLEWWVLNWNEPAQGFYRAIGAEPQDDWTTWRLTETALHTLAEQRR